jgi:hypothetical protein
MYVFRDAHQEAMAIVILQIDTALSIALERLLQMLVQQCALIYVQLLLLHLAIQEIGHVF